MRVISNKKLVEFGTLHPDADGPLQTWRKSIESRDFAGFADLKSVFRSADKVGNFFVFNIGGNKYRLVAIVQFERNKVFVREVLTHKEYSLWKP
ncbi:type II toxin-antitoxin system HigB family toxin [Duganella sp.]|uniref:type II toxin-antitoxin system HigB family toxin n=1 Tax=Duganella sp. TaxID=1904440 RepID=UPI0031DD7C6E